MIIGIIGVNPETERVVDFIRGYWPGTVVASIDELKRRPVRGARWSCPLSATCKAPA